MSFLGIVFLVLLVFQQLGRHEEEMIQQLSNSALVRLQSAQHWLFNQGNRLRVLTKMMENYTETQDEDLRIFNTWVASQSQYEGIFVLDSDGLVTSTNLKDLEGRSFADTRLHSVGQLTRVTEGVVVEGGKPRIYAGYPILDANNKPTGRVLGARLDLSELSTILTMRWGSGGREQAMVVAPGPVWVATLQPEYDLNTAQNPETLEKALSGLGGRGRYINYQGQEVYGVYRWEDEFSIALFVEAKVEDYPYSWELTFLMALLVLFLLGLPTTALLILVNVRVVKPLSQLLSAARVFASGRNPSRVPVSQNNELGLLSQVFNESMDTVEKLMKDLSQKERYYRSLVEKSGDFLMVLNTSGFIQFATEETLEALVEDKTLVKTLPLDSLLVSLDQDLPLLMEHLKNLQLSQLPHHIWVMTRAGEKLLLECQYRQLPVQGEDHVMIRARNITDRFYLEQKLRTQEKMDSLGIFSAGVAHDFNNLLTAVMGNLSMAKLDLAQGQIDEALLDKSLEQVARVKSLTDRLITVSMGGVIQKSPLQINKLVQELIEPLMAVPGLVLYHSLDSSLPAIMGDEGKLKEVLSEILDNSLHFMKRQGSLSIRTDLIYRSVEGDSGSSRPHVRLTFVDSGPGIRSEDLAKVFEPYFSTRSGSKGLGLSMVYAIMQMHKGYVEVSSNQGKGTEVVLVIPGLVS